MVALRLRSNRARSTGSLTGVVCTLYRKQATQVTSSFLCSKEDSEGILRAHADSECHPKPPKPTRAYRNRGHARLANVFVKWRVYKTRLDFLLCWSLQQIKRLIEGP